MKLKYRATPVHGIERRDGDGLWWWQYWKGVRHTWTWFGIPVRSMLRRRDRPMHEFIRSATRGA